MEFLIRKSRKGLLSLGLFCLVILGAYALASRPSAAAVKPLCGPTRLWDCTLRNGTHTTVAGTVCDIQKYEKKNKATCVASGI